MKNLWLLIIFVFFAVCTSNAQNKSYNLNDARGGTYKEISVLENISSQAFKDASRLRDLVINPVLQNNELIRTNDTILLDLFSDKKYKAYIDKIDIDVNGTLTIRARVVDYNYGYCIITTYNGSSFITIDVPENDDYFISRHDHLEKKYYLLQIDKSKQEILEGESPIIPSADNKQSDSSKKKQQLNSVKNIEDAVNDSVILEDEYSPDIITLLIVYTPAAAAWASANESNINNTISLLMSKTQLALDNSNTLLTIQLVYSEQVSYTELNSVDDLYNLRNTADGFMDNVHTLRNSYCADVVVLLENISYTGGQGYLLSSTSGSASNAFSLTRVQQASSGYTTVHEIGHNMGLHHHKLQNVQPGPGIFTYSAGWRWMGIDSKMYCSVMTYNSGTYFEDGISATRVPYFSNPGIQYQSIVVGDPAEADNARTIRQLKSVIASYRVGCCTPPSAPVPGTITQPTCEVGTGSVVLNGLPASGTWTLTRTPGAKTTTGTGTSITITGLSVGTFTYKVTNSTGCTSSPSGNVVITALPTAPTAPATGTVTQPTCSVSTGGVILNGLPATGIWTLTRTPGGTTTTGTGTSTTIAGLSAGTYNYSVTNASGCISSPSGNIVINAQPATPSAPGLGTIAQPTCSVSTGSVVLSGLPATGTWTLTRTPGGTTTTGTGTSRTITGLSAGTYTYTVTNSLGCKSSTTGNVVINAQPTTPTAPTVGTITQPSCSGPTGSIVLNGLPATGTWTLTRTPGGVTTTGTGTSRTITGLSAGTYSYTVTNSSGCISSASGNIVVNAQPIAPTIVTSPDLIASISLAAGGGNVTSDGRAPVTARGLCWSTGQNPTVALSTKTADGTGTGIFTSSIPGLTANTTYYVRAYATNCVGTSYGLQEAFTTLNSNTVTVTDIDGNVYNTVIIGEQVWMAGNLKTTKYRNGELIGTTTPATKDISSESTPKYQWPQDGIESNAAAYGRLYTWFAVNDIRNICPTGWHVPVDAEWTILTDYLGGLSTSGAKLKETGYTHWLSPNAGATNETGFTALPGGNRISSGGFGGIGTDGQWWSSGEVSVNDARIRGVGNSYSDVYESNNGKRTGYSVRCILGGVPTGIDNIQTEELSVFPNPVSGLLNIEYRNDNFRSINILNSQGGMIAIEKAVSPGQQLDFSNYKSGIYILEFIKKSGEIIRIKIVND